ncbi:MAG: hypothetical protein WCI22_06550 [Actinomycetota bacterium]
MHETAEDLRALQTLLDDSAAAGGRHLTSIITPHRCGSALEDMQDTAGVVAYARIDAHRMFTCSMDPS